MPFSRPPLQDLINRTSADAIARLGIEELLRRDDLQVLARVLAGASHNLHGHIAWLSEQVIIDTAESEYLERWANIWGVERKPAAAAVGNVTFTGSNGTVIPSGTLLARTDGIEYTTNAEATIASGTATAAVTAVVAGASGNAVSGVIVSLTTPITGLSSQATVAAGDLVGGADTETDTAMRARLLARIQATPHGGASADYIAWALEVAGVTRAWVYPGELGLGTVTVRFVRDDDASIVPDAAEVQAVLDHIDTLRPVTAGLTVVAPVAVPLNLTIALTPNTSTVQAAVLAEIKDLLRRAAEPGGTILISHIREAISLAAGETNHVLTVPSADVTHTTGQIATMGTITWA